jgi:hypothetical protein
VAQLYSRTRIYADMRRVGPVQGVLPALYRLKKLKIGLRLHKRTVEPQSTTTTTTTTTTNNNNNNNTG